MSQHTDFLNAYLERVGELVDADVDALILITTLLGLLVIIDDELIDRLPELPFGQWDSWGIKANSIKAFGKCDYGHEHLLNFRQFIRRLRLTVAELDVVPVLPFELSSEKTALEFTFRSRSGFHVELSTIEIRALLSGLVKDLTYKRDE